MIKTVYELWESPKNICVLEDDGSEDGKVVCVLIGTEARTGRITKDDLRIAEYLRDQLNKYGNVQALPLD